MGWKTPSCCDFLQEYSSAIHVFMANNEWVCECLLWIFNGHSLLSFCAFFVQKKRLQTDETDREVDARRWQRSCARSKWKVKAKWAINDAYRLSIVVVVVVAWVIGQEEKRLQIDRERERERGRMTSGNTCPSFSDQLCWLCSLPTHTYAHLNRNTLICNYLHNFIGHFVRFLSTLIST